MKINFLIVLLALTLSVSAQDNLARVKKVNGIEAYVMNEPLRQYDVLCDVGTGFKAESALTGGIVNKSISGRMEQFIKKAKEQNAGVEAVVYTSGKRVVGVKFKDAGTTETIGMARVSKVKGMPVYVMCDPVQNYAVLKSKGGGIKWKSAFTAGIVNNSIEDDVEKIVNKLDDTRGCDGILFDGSKEGEAIAFKK